MIYKDILTFCAAGGKIFSNGLRSQQMQLVIKHMDSTASDLAVQYEIDSARQIVEMRTEFFDSSLIQHFIESTLFRDMGINGIRDDREEWHPPCPPYRIFLAMGGSRFEVTAHRLPIRDQFTVVLQPLA